MVVHSVYKRGREIRENCTKELSLPMIQFLFYFECVIFSHHPSTLASLG